MPRSNRHRQNQVKIATPITELLKRHRITAYSLWQKGYIRSRGSFTQETRINVHNIKLKTLEMLSSALHISITEVIKELLRLEKIYPPFTSQNNYRPIRTKHRKK